EEACRILALAGTDSSPKSLALAQTPLVQHLRLVSADGQASQNVEQDLNGVTVLANYKPVYVEGRIVGAIVTFKDMSELRQLAERITDINRYVDALRSQSHEFMNKLHVIMGLVNNGRFGEVGNYIKELVDSGTAEGRIIHDAVKDPLIAGFLASKYSHAREMGVSLRFEMHGILPPLENAALRNGLVTILGNLIDNALDAVQKMPKRAVKVSLDVCQNELTLAVADTGSGIAEAEQQTIFSKSYSSKGPHRGLGLWLVSKSITALGGCIELESQKGEGVIFTVRLPLQPREKPC
ncbi:GHKL domain-containing protein, partial [Desulfovibrio sp. OttesenSCG-928-M16]|nr:GHKL domain-containing protein [Desulfovibrio sp. OttesenSCG-928-M16]